MPNQWDPTQYEKFERERNQPFFDLLQLVHPMHHPRILDIGCGNGKLTKLIHETFHASSTLGIDSSTDMLAKAQHLKTQSLTFEAHDIESWMTNKNYDLVVANASLQWVPDHPIVFRKLVKILNPGGQLAIQMPANQQSPTHLIAAELAKEEPFQQFFSSNSRTMCVLTLEEYAYLLEQLGFENQTLRIQLYTHFLESTATILEWLKGSLLTFYKSFLPHELYLEFLKEYQKRLIAHFGWSEPFFFTIRRLFLWAQLPHH